MDVRYRRELNETYLILDGEMKPDTYAMRIMEENQIPGLLDCRIHWADGREEYYFGITGCRPLHKIWEKKQACLEDIRELLFGIYRVLEHLEEYLIDVNHVLLEPEFLYVPEEGLSQVRLCCHPGRREDFFGRLRQLIQYFLNKIDPMEEKSAQAAYELFQISRREFFGFEDLFPALDGEEEAISAPEKAEAWMPEEEEDPVILPPKKKQKRPMAGTVVMAAGMGTIGLFYLLGLWEPPDNTVSWGVLILAVALVFLAGLLLREWEMRRRPQRKEEAPALDFPDSGEAVTEFLQGNFVPETRERLLISQNSLKHDTIHISRMPFVIGKMEGACDYQLKRSVISRIHARLEQQEGEIYLIDCNSTNGTYLNGVKLEPNRRYPVQAGDEIMLADLKYLFQ
nr:DUF6382 domain-containing protein [Cuneatibacter sp. NSJ-177]